MDRDKGKKGKGKKSGKKKKKGKKSGKKGKKKKKEKDLTPDRSALLHLTCIYHNQVHVHFVVLINDYICKLGII